MYFEPIASISTLLALKIKILTSYAGFCLITARWRIVSTRREWVIWPALCWWCSTTRACVSGRLSGWWRSINIYRVPKTTISGENWFWQGGWSSFWYLNSIVTFWTWARVRRICCLHTDGCCYFLRDWLQWLYCSLGCGTFLRGQNTPVLSKIRVLRYFNQSLCVNGAVSKTVY